MTSEINWGLITNGSQFENLVHILLFHIDPKTRLSGRPGPDRGIDAKSGDMKTVYQAKYHKVGNISNVISDAKSECEKIKKYRKKDHSNYNSWKDVSNWIMATNIDVNETDMTLWSTKILPLFKEQDIIPELWAKTILEAKLINFPNIIQHFFGGKNRTVLSLTEA